MKINSIAMKYKKGRKSSPISETVVTAARRTDVAKPADMSIFQNDQGVLKRLTSLAFRRSVL